MVVALREFAAKLLQVGEGRRVLNSLRDHAQPEAPGEMNGRGQI
jgi:hypothetical protein